MSYLSKQNKKSTELKKLILLLLASFVVTAANAQFFKRKEKYGEEKTQAEKQAERKAARQEKKTSKAAQKEEEKNQPQQPKKLSEKEQKNPPLENIKWALLDISGKPLNAAPDRMPYMVMYSKGSKLEGYTGCNQLSGTYDKGRNEDIGYKPVTTKMACSNTQWEDDMVKALNGANAYKLNGQNLLLYHDNMLLAIFEAKFD